jgi:hypothetical protein
MNKIVASSGEQRTLEELVGAGDRLNPADSTASGTSFPLTVTVSQLATAKRLLLVSRLHRTAPISCPTLRWINREMWAWNRNAAHGRFARHA